MDNQGGNKLTWSDNRDDLVLAHDFDALCRSLGPRKTAGANVAVLRAVAPFAYHPASDHMFFISHILFHQPTCVILSSKLFVVRLSFSWGVKGRIKY